MTYSKKLVVLAKSIKHGAFCIAGKDIESYNWVRPVKDTPFKEEELCNLSNHTVPIKIFDVVEMTFIKENPLVFQPENELVDMNVEWKYLGEFQIGDLNILIDGENNDLLDQIKDHSIHKNNIKQLNLQNSLQLIRITNSNNARIIYKLDSSQRYYKPTLKLDHRGISYTLPITDPTIPLSYKRRETKNLENAYVTIGIGEEYMNNHYIFVVMLTQL